MSYLLWLTFASTVIPCWQSEATSCNVYLTTATNHVQLGSNVTLTCRLCNMSNTTEIRFQKDGSQIAGYVSGNLSVLNSAFSLDVNTATDDVTTLTLTIIQFASTSEGNYVCDILNPAYTSSQFIAYTVPVTSVTLTPAVQIVSLLVNKEISNIRCSSTYGRPSPTITWYLDNKTPSDVSDDQNITYKSNYSTSDKGTDSVVTFTPMALDQDKSIYCNASNGHTPISSSKLKLNILVPPDKPKLQFRTCKTEPHPLNGALKVIEGTNVYVTCSATSNPPPAITWNPNPEGASSTLLVSNVTPSQTGTYQCTSENIMDTNTNTGVTIGRNSSSFQLEVLVPPQICQSRNLTAVQDKSIFLPCLCLENQTSTTFSWSKTGSDLTSSNPILHIFKANSSHEGFYKCTVSYALEPTNCEPKIYQVETTFYIRVIRLPNVPRQVSVVKGSITENSFAVEWELTLEDRGTVNTTILWSKQIINHWNMVAVSPTLTRIMLRGLESGTTYNVKMFAESEAGVSDETEIIAITTTAVQDNNKDGMVGMGVILGSSIGSTAVLIIIAIVMTLAVVRCRGSGEPAPKVQRPFSNTYDELAAPPATTEQYEGFDNEKTTGLPKTMETSFTTNKSNATCKATLKISECTFEANNKETVPRPDFQLENDYMNM